MLARVDHLRRQRVEPRQENGTLIGREIGIGIVRRQPGQRRFELALGDELLRFGQIAAKGIRRQRGAASRAAAAAATRRIGDHGSDDEGCIVPIEAASAAGLVTVVSGTALRCNPLAAAAVEGTSGGLVEGTAVGGGIEPESRFG